MQIAMTLGFFPDAIHSVWLSSWETNMTWYVRPKKGAGQVINGLFAPMSSQITLIWNSKCFTSENYYFCVKRENAAAVDGPNTVVTSLLPSRLSIHHNWHGVYIVLMINPFPNRDEDGVHSAPFSQSRKSWNAHVHASELSFIKLQVRFLHAHAHTHTTYTHMPYHVVTAPTPLQELIGPFGIYVPTFLTLSLGSFQWWRKIQKKEHILVSV